MAEKDPFDVLTELLGFPGSTRLRQIYEYLMTPKHAKVASALPGSAEEVAQKTGIPVDEVRGLLDDLWRKGVVFPKDFDKRDYIRFARDIVQLHDATLATQGLDLERDRRYFELWHEFGVHEFYQKTGEMLSAIFTKPFWRVLPVYGAIKDIPGVLPHENILEIIKGQELIGVVPCSCRQVMLGIDKKCGFTDETELWHCVQFGRGAEYVIKRGSGKQLTGDEALKLLDEIEKDGLVHMGPNTAEIMKARTICNCCSDCCEFFSFFKFGNVPFGALVAKSRFEAQADAEKCTGCQTCIGRCHFDAISLVRPGGSKKYKARVDPEKCFGCGVCVVGCETKAMKFRLVRPPEHILAD